MSARHALLATLFLAAGAAGVRAQEPTPEPRPERFRYRVFPDYRFDFRIPRMTMRMAPRIRIDTDRIRMQALERSQERMNRSWELMNRLRDRQFEMRNRQFDLRNKLRQVRPRIDTKVMERMHDRMNMLSKIRPFTYRRRYRDI
jgi:hypothetical protein